MATTAELGIEIPPLVELAQAGSSKLLIGLISNKDIPWPWPNLMGMKWPSPCNRVPFQASEGDQGQARSAAIKFAKNERADWLLMLDDDTYPPPTTVYRLQAIARSHSRPCVVAANYNLRGVKYPVSVSCARRTDGELAPILADGTVQTVETLGFGCALFPKRTIEMAPDDWFVDGRFTGGVAEDWHASLVAHAMGIDLLVDTSLQCSHWDYRTGEVY